MNSAVMAVAAVAILAVKLSSAQNCIVDLNSEKQLVRGFGGMVHIPWIGDLSASERTLAFGNGPTQLGLTVLRIAVPDGNTSTSSYVATAKVAIAAGGLVFASPWNSGGNMSSSQFASYAEHLNSFAVYMKGQGAELYAISVQNEPDYGDWRHWTAADVRDFIINYGDQISTRLMTAESFQYRKNYYDDLLNDARALANWDILGAHTYGTQLRDYPYPLFDQKGIPAGKERWMTEVYTNSNTDANQWPDALGVATDVHNSMVEGQFNVYTWWYIKRNYGFINNGAITKRGYCIAHYTKFVRPGALRVDATKNPVNGVNVSAYKSKNADSLVIVAVNTTSSSQTVNFTIKGGIATSLTKYTTSASKSIAEEGNATVSSGGTFSGTLESKSVSTWAGTVTGTGIVVQEKGKQVVPAIVPAKELSIFSVYDLSGRRVNDRHTGTFGKTGYRTGLYIIRNVVSGTDRIVNVTK
ncbi:MAG: glucuronoxylanase [Chitinispirillaceae bacterium]|nr:glucuronoxylanase [Chitinispirillaceae bacterium]